MHVSDNVKWYSCWKTVWWLKIKSCNPAILLLGIYPKKVKAGTQTDTGTTVFTATLIIVAERWKQLRWPSVMSG